MINSLQKYKDNYGVTYFMSTNINVEEIFSKLYGMSEPIDYSEIDSNNIFLIQVQTIELLSSMEKKAHDQAIENLEMLSKHFNNKEQKNLYKALKLQVEYKYREAHNIYRTLLNDNPKNRLIFFAIHMLEFNQGWQVEMLDSARLVVNSLEDKSDYYGFAKGIEAFSLIENGHFEEARKSADIALEINSKDIYAIHAICHYFYEIGKYREGIMWMNEKKANWIYNKGMRIHIWWHLAIFYLFDLKFDEVEDILNNEIMIKDSENGLEDLDATALLWRLYLLKNNNLNHCETLDNWDEYLENNLFIFNDLHALMAYIMKNDNEKITTYLKEVLSRPYNKLNHVQSDLLYGFYYYGKKEYAKSSEILKKLLNNSSFGGSNAQRDIIALTLFFALKNSNETLEAKMLLSSHRAFKHESKLRGLLHLKLGEGQY